MAKGSSPVRTDSTGDSNSAKGRGKSLKAEMASLARLGDYKRGDTVAIDLFLSERFMERPWWLIEDACLLILNETEVQKSIVRTLGSALRRRKNIDHVFYEKAFPTYGRIRTDISSACAAGSVSRKEADGQVFVEAMSVLRWSAGPCALWYLARQWEGRSGSWPDIASDGQACSVPFLARIIQLTPGIERKLVGASVIPTYAGYLTVTEAAERYADEVEYLRGKKVTLRQAKVIVSRACDRGELQHVNRRRDRRIEPNSLDSLILAARDGELPKKDDEEEEDKKVKPRSEG